MCLSIPHSPDSPPTPSLPPPPSPLSLSAQGPRNFSGKYVSGGSTVFRFGEGGHLGNLSFLECFVYKSEILKIRHQEDPSFSSFVNTSFP